MKGRGKMVLMGDEDIGKWEGEKGKCLRRNSGISWERVFRAWNESESRESWEQKAKEWF